MSPTTNSLPRQTPPEQPGNVLIVDPNRASDEVAAQIQRDKDWFAERADRRLRARLMTKLERIEYRPSTATGISIIARCSHCGGQYVRPIISWSDHAERMVFMNDDQLLEYLDKPSGRFFRHITEPLPPLDVSQAIEAQRLRDKEWLEDRPERALRARLLTVEDLYDLDAINCTVADISFGDVHAIVIGADISGPVAVPATDVARLDELNDNEILLHLGAKSEGILPLRTRQGCRGHRATLSAAQSSSGLVVDCKERAAQSCQAHRQARVSAPPMLDGGRSMSALPTGPRLLSPLGEEALERAQSGFKIFPCLPRDKDPLGRLVPHGFKERQITSS